MKFEITFTDYQSGKAFSVITDNYEVKHTGNTGRNCATIQIGYYPEGKSRRKWLHLLDKPEYKGGNIVIREAITGRRIETYSF